MTKLKPTIERRNNFIGVPVKRVSWSSILGGVVVSMAVLVMLGMLGMTLGLLGPEAGVALGTSAGLSWAVIGALSLYAGGWTAGRLCGLQRRFEGAMHGLITWALASVVIFVGSTTIALNSNIDAPAQPAFQGPPAAALQDRSETVSSAQERASQKRLDVEHFSNEMERRLRDLVDRSELNEAEKLAIHKEVAPRIAPLVDAVLRPDYQDERTILITALVNSTGLNLEAVTSAVDSWIESTASKAKERSMSRGRFKHRHFDGMGPRHERARIHRPASQISVNGRAIAGWSFLFLAFGAAAATLGGLLGSGTMMRRAQAPTGRSQSSSQDSESPTAEEE